MFNSTSLQTTAAAPLFPWWQTQLSLRSDVIVVLFILYYFRYIPINIWETQCESAFNYASLRSESVMRRGQDNEVQGTTHQSPGDNASKFLWAGHPSQHQNSWAGTISSIKIEPRRAKFTNLKMKIILSQWPMSAPTSTGSSTPSWPRFPSPSPSSRTSAAEGDNRISFPHWYVSTLLRRSTATQQHQSAVSHRRL